MNNYSHSHARRLPHLVLTTTFLLGACALDDELELDPSAEATPVADTGAPGGLEANASGHETHATWMTPPGIDPECMDRSAPIIASLLDPVDFDCALGLDPGDALWTSWTHERLFETGSDWVMTLQDAPPPSLQRYCKYEYTGSAAKLEASYEALHAELVAYPGTDPDEIATDCIGTVPMAGLDDASVVSAFNEVYRAGVDAVDHDDLVDLDHGRVRVALLDTATAGEEPVHAHASQMRTLLEDLSCPPGESACTDQIHDALVTPRLGVDGVDWYQGGDTGYATDFALGAYYAIASWLEVIAEGDFQHLVLAAPVGYDSGATYANDPSRATMAAVDDVLTMAACYGVLVVAPAGNVRPGTCDDGQDGLLAPASFELIEAPDALTCAALGHVPTWDTGDFPVHSLSGTARKAYAVGGLGHTELPIPNARPQSMPRLAALAQAAAGDPDNAPSLRAATPVTGTSAGAVAVAAAAALRWRIDPELSVDELMDAIHDASWATGLDAEDGAFVNSPVRRLSIAGVLADAGHPVVPAGSAPEASTATAAIAAATAAVVSSEGSDLVDAGETSDPGALVCELGQFSEVVKPMPDRPICGLCSGNLTGGPGGKGALYMSIVDQAWAVDMSVTDAYFHVTDAVGNLDTIVLSVDAVDDINNAPPERVLEYLFDAPDTVQAELEFHYVDSSGGTSVYSSTIPISGGGA